MNDVPFLVFVTEANTKGDGFLAQATDLYCSTTSLAYTRAMYNDTIIIEQMRKLTFMKATVIHIMSFILLYRIMPGFSYNNITCFNKSYAFYLGGSISITLVTS